MNPPATRRTMLLIWLACLATMCPHVGYMILFPPEENDSEGSV